MTMMLYNRFSPVCALLLLLACSITNSAAELDPEVMAQLADPSTPDRVQVMVTLKVDGGRRELFGADFGSAASRAKIAAAEARAMAQLHHDVTATNDDETVVGMSEDIPMMTLSLTQEQVEAMQNNPDVADITFDYPVYASGSTRGGMKTNEPQDVIVLGELDHENDGNSVEDPTTRKLSLSSARNDIRSEARWQQQNDGSGVVVAVLDTGVDYTHPSIRTLKREFCFVPGCSRSEDVAGSGIAMDRQSHGTHVASTIVGLDNNIRGIAPGADLLAVKVLGDDGSGSTSGIINALTRLLAYKRDNPLHIINMSLGSSFGLTSGTCDNRAGLTTYASIIEQLRVAGVLTVVAAGNDGNDNAMGSPACISTTLSVGATNTGTSIPASFTSSSGQTSVFSPGTSIDAAVPGGYGRKSGTSMATPIAAGCAALIIQDRVQNGGDTTPNGVELRLEASSRRIVHGGINFPIIDCSPDAASGDDDDDNADDDDDDDDDNSPPGNNDPIVFRINRRGRGSGDQCLPIPNTNCVASEFTGFYRRNINCDIDLVSGSGRWVAHQFFLASGDGFYLNGSSQRLDTVSEIEGFTMKAGDRLRWNSDRWWIGLGWVLCLEPETAGAGGSSILQASSSGTNEAEGVLFEVKAESDIQITGLDVRFVFSGTNQRVEVLTTVDDFRSFERIQDVVVTTTGQTPLPHFEAISMKAGETRWFWVRSDAKPVLSPGTIVGGEHVTNHQLTIYEGYSVNNNRASGPWVFNGAVNYNY